jgi:hypothetical protein
MFSVMLQCDIPEGVALFGAFQLVMSHCEVHIFLLMSNCTFIIGFFQICMFMKGYINLCFSLVVILRYEEVYSIVEINFIKHCHILREMKYEDELNKITHFDNYKKSYC